ncbi:hypothetical protein BH10PSE12_BH10PSE12_10650 [soil metagenome]
MIGSLLALLVSAAPAVEPGYAAYPYASGVYGDGYIYPYDANTRYRMQCANNGYSLMKAYNAPSAYKMRLTGDGTKWAGDVATSQRCELINMTFYFNGQYVWSSYKFRINSSANSQRFFVVGQLWNDPIEGDPYTPPPIELSYSPGKISLDVHTDTNMANGYYVAKSLGSFPVNDNEWYNIVTQYRTGPSGTGVIRLWVNGVLKVAASQEKIGFARSKHLFYKFGAYTGPMLTGSALIDAEYMNMEVSANSLRDRITAPLP